MFELAYSTTLSDTYGVERRAISKHRKKHLGRLLAKGYEAEQASRADDLLRDMQRLRARGRRACEGRGEGG